MTIKYFNESSRYIVAYIFYMGNISIQWDGQISNIACAHYIFPLEMLSEVL